MLQSLSVLWLALILVALEVIVVGILPLLLPAVPHISLPALIVLLLLLLIGKALAVLNHLVTWLGI